MNKKFFLDINFIGVILFCVLVTVFLLIKMGEAFTEIDSISKSIESSMKVIKSNP
ncbi:MAG: hypothetical protein UV01_C0009G0031 [Parcubacteria group bacterium GW2011_GWA2_42_14]|nr:MAG: hypothetical protein UV01_C0009G0031 [Parcubacteria group bacterium GW2011_GWA2_42_14]